MDKNYRKIEFEVGQNLENAVKLLKSHKDLVCGDFNGKTLYSDIDDLDSAYEKVLGQSKAEFDEQQRKSQEAYEKRKKEHSEAIPELVKVWFAKGNDILDEEYRQRWAEIVPIRLKDLYQGMELGACLDIIKPLNEGCELEKAKEIITAQDHSGMSFSLVCAMVKEFCNRGSKFASYVRT